MLKGPCKGKIFIRKMKIEEWRQLLLGSETLPFFVRGVGVLGGVLSQDGVTFLQELDTKLS
jgi:hypothetical protein